MKRSVNGWMASLVVISPLLFSIANISYAQSSRVIALSAGQQHSVAVKQNGTVWAWGDNTQGQLGDGTTEQRATPVQVFDPNEPTGYLTGVTAISSGTAYGLNVIGHTLALKQNGTVWGWGNGYEGQLGDGEQVLRSAPVQVEHISDPTGYLTNIIAIGAGDVHSVAARADGTVWSWGNNGYGQLGDGSTTRRLTAVQVTGLSDVVAVAAGENHSVALKQDGTVWAWGNNSYGQLGDGYWAQRITPVQVVDPTDPSGRLTGVTAISAGGAFTLALKSDGTMRAWGFNLDGRLGDGTSGSSNWKNTPVRVVDPTDPTSYLTGIIAIACGDSHSMAVKQGGTVWTWGYNGRGQLGDGTKTNRNTPGQVPGLTQVVAVEGGYGHSLAARQDGKVWAWGGNWDGQLGDGTTDERLTPVPTLFPLQKERQLLEVRGSYFVTPGDTLSMLVQYDNTFGRTLEDVIVIFEPPPGFAYVSSTKGGIYRGDRSQVFWKLGNLTTGATGALSATFEVPPGLPNHLDLRFFALFAARNIETTINIDNYLNYDPLDVLSEREFSASEINSLLSANRDLENLFGYLTGLGYVFNGVVKQFSFSDGSTSITFVLLTAEVDGVAFLHKIGNRVFAEKYQGNTYSLLDKEGGNKWDINTGVFSTWGSWAEAQSPAKGQCILNCVTETAKDWNRYIKGYSGKYRVCVECNQSGGTDSEKCSACAQIYLLSHKEKVRRGEGGLQYGKSIERCVSDCERPETWQCTENTTLSSCHQYWGIKEDVIDSALDKIYQQKILGSSWVVRFFCKKTSSGTQWVLRVGGWNPESFEWCEVTESSTKICVDDPEPHCAESCSCPCPVNEGAFEDVNALGAVPYVCYQETLVAGAWDPNAKSVDVKGNALPGQELTYTVEYENVGEGTAYGVFILDKLDTNLDENTLAVNNGGSYSAASRLVGWDIGDVPPHGQGSVTFHVRVKNGLPSGSEIVNFADIYFPSVPQITPTNAVVNIVKTIAADPNTIETVSEAATPITLTGRDSGSNPLIYRISQTPLYGTISGTPPNIIYTSMEEFSGQDEFYYVVNNGLIDSEPARVFLKISSSPTDANPPTVVSTYPKANETDVHVDLDIFRPILRATFSEPIDAATVTPSTVTVSGGITGTVTYDEKTWTAYFTPSNAFSPSTTYTAQLTTGVRDKAGNPLASVHTWQFTTESPANIAVLLPDGGEGVSFGQGYVNLGSVDKVVSIASTGSVDLVLGTITIGGGDAGDFIRGTDTCSGKILRQFEQCTVRVSFQPASVGTKNAQLSIPSNDPDTSLLNIALVGSAVTAPPILLLQPSAGEPFSSCSAFSLPTFAWTTTGSFKSYEIQFSLDQQFGSVPAKVKAKGQNTQATLASGTWKKIVLLVGSSGGTVYWRVVGMPADKTQTTATSNVDYFVIGSPDAVGNPNLAPVNGTSPPTLSWDNNCNTKFKAWFGNRADFTEPGVKKKGFSFSDSVPADAGGVFTTLLSAGQWASIKKLIAGEGSSTIYWYVESWDPLKRYQKTGVMQFVVTQ
jgi:uncharacterized repeat protein (TIGR01451 family)